MIPLHWCAVGIVVCLFALIALLPEWDGKWGSHDDDPPDDGAMA